MEPPIDSTEQVGARAGVSGQTVAISSHHAITKDLRFSYDLLSLVEASSCRKYFG